MFRAILADGAAQLPFAAVLDTIDDAKAGSKLSKTGKQLAELKDEAREEGRIDGIRKGHREGLETGLAEGREAGQKEAYEQALTEHRELLNQFSRELQNFVRELTAEAQAWARQAEETLTEEISGIAREVIGQELTLNREAIAAMVHKSLGQAGVMGEVRLRLNPSDRPFIDTHREELLKTFAQITGLTLVDDLSIGAGCIVETSAGSVDSSPERQLAEFDASLLEDAARSEDSERTVDSVRQASLAEQEDAA